MLNPFLMMKEVEQYFFLTPGSLIMTNRKITTANARAVAMYIMRLLYNYSFQEIGDYFDRDHSTVVHNCKKIVNILQNKKNIILIQDIITLIGRIEELNNS